MNTFVKGPVSSEFHEISVKLCSYATIIINKKCVWYTHSIKHPRSTKNSYRLLMLLILSHRTFHARPLEIPQSIVERKKAPHIHIHIHTSGVRLQRVNPIIQPCPDCIVCLCHHLRSLFTVTVNLSCHFYQQFPIFTRNTNVLLNFHSAQRTMNVRYVRVILQDLYDVNVMAVFLLESFLDVHLINRNVLTFAAGLI